MNLALSSKLTLLSVAIIIYALTLPHIFQTRSRYQIETISNFGQLPSQAVQALSLEFKGIIADYLLLKTITFRGQKLIVQENLTEADWKLINEMLERVTDLDGRFWDPYLFAEMMMTWDAKMYEETNKLLLKATENKPDDFRPLFFLGFNNFFFQKNFNKAANYIQRASQAPGAPYYLKGLAARLSLYGEETATGIIFLEDMLQETTDPKTQKYLKMRIIALKHIATLEKKVIQFDARHEKLPSKLEDLVSAGLIDKIPEDPYGGKYFLLKNGRVYSTSKLVIPKK